MTSREVSLWLDDPRLDLRFPTMAIDIQADVVIVGAGITGLSTAVHLRQRLPHLDVVVLEAESVGAGASGRSSGALTAIPELRFGPKLERDGEEETRRAIAFQAAGVSSALGLIRDGAIDCDLRDCGYLIMGLERHVPYLLREAEAMRQLGVEGRLLTRPEVSSVVHQDFYEAAVRGPSQWINPARYTAGLARHAADLGAQIFEGSRVAALRAGDPTEVELSSKNRVRARTVVVAANAQTTRLGVLRGRLFPLHTAVLASVPLSQTQLDGLGWAGREVLFEAETAGHTFVLTPDNRLFCRGTLRYQFGNGMRPIDLVAAEQRLRRAIAARFPTLADVQVTHRWSCVLDMTRDQRPAIGRAEGHPNVLFAAGYSGHGLAYASLAGRLLTEMIEGSSSAELAYAAEHPMPPRLPFEPFRYLALRPLARRREQG